MQELLVAKLAVENLTPLFKKTLYWIRNGSQLAVLTVHARMRLEAMNSTSKTRWRLAINPDYTH
jgi:hypothetical protein